jgi:diguanylate cyclase (GGDEF)-like protein/PAS domain S-box-containing protein
LHSLLRRQLRRYLGSEEPPAELKDLLTAIDDAYLESDSDRELVERSLELASDELLERNALLKQDVEKRLKAEQQLTETLSVLASTLDSTADGILVVSAHDRKVSSFNQRFLDMWRIPRELAETHDDEVLISHVLEQLCDPEAFLTTVASLYGDPEASSLDILKFKDGRVFERTSLPQRIDGKAVGRVWSFSDVSERAHAELALQRSEEYFRSLIEKSSDVILVLDTQACVTYTSPSLTRVMGYAPEDLHGLNGLTFVHPDDLVETTKSFDRTILGTNEDVSIEFRGRHADGTWRVLESMSRQIVGTDGQPTVVINFRDVTERKRAEEMIRFMAYHDALTSLPNRDLLRDRIDQAIGQARRNDEHLAVIYLDLDRMKDVNDSIGHSGGDDFLREVADRLSHISRDGDTLARLGGDEFVLLMPQVEKVQEAVNFANRILETLRRPLVIGGQEFRATASVGLAIFPDDGRDANTLVRNADVAMYRAKEQGRDNLQMYTASMNASIVARLSLERELMHALERGEFVLYYQPIATVETQEIVGAEALIRWLHPERGLIPPDEFIPTVEETGAILQIGAWVLDTACRQGAEWEKMCPGFRVAVNVSAKQLREPNFIAMVRDALWNSGISPGALELEVTETAAMESPERIAQALGVLRSMGILPVIDDFGTGYSSLTHLKQLPVVKLKIDKSFTHDLTSDANDAAIASATIAMAHSLKLVVTAEGVETQEQLDVYRLLGCDEMQGYLLAKPGPPEEITRMIEESHSKPMRTLSSSRTR